MQYDPLPAGIEASAACGPGQIRASFVMDAQLCPERTRLTALCTHSVRVGY